MSNKRSFRPLSVLAVVLLAATSDASDSPTSPYEATYEVTIERNGQFEKYGTLRIIETRGQLLQKLEVGKKTSLFFFDGKRSYSDPSGSPMLVDGFGPGLFSELFTYLPFDYLNSRMFYPLSKYTDQRDHDAKIVKNLPKFLWNLKDSNYSINDSRSGNDLSYDVCTLKASKGGNGLIRSAYLLIGPPGAKSTEYEYSGFRNLGSWAIPSVFTAQTYRSSDVQNGPRVLDRLLKYKLKNFSLNPPNQRPIRIDDVLKPGVIVSYNGTVKNAGVLYDPAKGTFEDQLQRAAKASPSFVIPPKKIEDRSNIPAIGAVGFGGLALFFAYLRRRSFKKA